MKDIEESRWREREIQSERERERRAINGDIIRIETHREIIENRGERGRIIQYGFSRRERSEPFRL